ncbi:MULTISPECIES: cell wall-binding repeat-containing protein [Microbacterium]|uniref:Cell wall-binding repeat-containing protein n=1 Tax=Microbacterium wangchenii TaxID=2541726 RepID=A0ABX5SS07_9MICO|nr:MULTISPECIES: cell wall-binding repeat-containing protein [Microbacterium]MCK6066756.1 cell wall-binding repeat-containing protein [Microbacterium sp. EYE_512]QBR88075.1 cell wall-binding repeat-containing protein [Microbacterium wangchenii]TXK18135.1 cell wall-binding repeat-containing protein [Microbacterium wangchenii]
MFHTRERPRRASKLAVLALAGVLLGSALGAASPSGSAQAAGGSIFDGGMIISDAEFFDGAAMSAAQVQAFLNDKGGSCVPAPGGPACIKDYRADLPAMAADRYCKAVPGKARATAAEIIAAAGQACGISPRVLLVMLQKEQSLVTRTKPTTTHYDKALGQSCPDTAPCDPRAAGFVNQMYLGARQQQIYVQNPTWYNYRPGRVNTIQWHPDKAACGTSQVYIHNQATANLYIYTPYRPNIAALAAGWGTGDDCSSYGNRNFYNYYAQWFRGVTGAPAAQVAPCTVPPATEIAPRGDRLVVTAASLNARGAPTTACGTGAVSLAKGTVVQASGTYGAWTRASVNGVQMWLTTKYLSTFTVVPGTPTISGNAASGQILTAATGTWTPQPSSFSYQWNRDGKVIAGATASSYRVTNDDATARISVTVSAHFGGEKTQSTSASVSARGFAADRLDGQDRYETAVAVSRASFANGTSTVYLVVGTDFADALAAAPLAANKDAALLLTRPGALPASTAAELKRLAPQRVVLIGGTGVLDAGMPDRLRTLLGSSLTVDRIGGTDRYDTARMIAAQFGSAPTVYVATGRDFADALGAAAIAGHRSAPVILVKGETGRVDDQTLRTLTALGAKDVVIAGAEGAVSKGIADQLSSRALAVQRYGGIDRFATNAALNSASFGAGTRSMVLATGRDFPDALTGAVLAAERGVPIFVNRGGCVTGETADFMLRNGGSAFTLVGGVGVMNASVGKFQRC